MSEHLPTQPVAVNAEVNTQPAIITELPNWTTYEVAAEAPGLNFNGRVAEIIARVDAQTPEATYESLREFADSIESTAASGLLETKSGEVYTARDIRSIFTELTDWSESPPSDREANQNPLARLTSKDGLRDSVRRIIENKSVSGMFFAALKEKQFEQMKEEKRVVTDLGGIAVERLIINP